MLEQFSAAVEKVYAAAGDPDLWPQALGAIEKLSNSVGVVVNLVDKSDPTLSRLLNSPGIFELLDGDSVADYNRDVLPHCPRIAWGVEHPDGPFVCDYMIMSEAEMNRDLAYDWYLRHGLRYFVGSPLLQTPRYAMMWSFQRSPSQGHAQGPDIELFQLIKPHLARALSLADRLGCLQSIDRFSSAIFEALPQAIFALDGNGSVAFANAHGRALLARLDGLTVENGHLATADQSEQAALDTLIRSALAPLDGHPSSWTRVSRPSGRMPYALFAAPLRVDDEQLTGADVRVLLIAHDPDEHHQVSTPMLVQVYGFTEAEARLASALGIGHSLESAAALIGIQASTARSQLKSIFRKLSISRQQDLVRMLASSSMMPVIPA